MTDKYCEQIIRKKRLNFENEIVVLRDYSDSNNMHSLL